MKRIIVIASLLLCFGWSATSQETDRETGLFIGVGTGMNFGFDGLKFEDRPTSHNGAGFASDFYLGGWVAEGLGLRAGFQGFSISDRYTDFGNRKYAYFHGDILFRPHKNIVPYLHGGYVQIVNAGPAGGAGILFPIQLGKHVSLVPDLKATAYSSRIFGSLNNNVALTLSATVGLAIRLGGKPRPKPAPTYVRAALPPIVVHDTIRVPEVITRVEERVIRDTVYREMAPEKISGLALFDTNKSELRPEVFSELNMIVRWFNTHPDTRAVIEGHTDNTASASYNQALSERRARAVYMYFIEHGISPSRLSYVGYGLTRPVASNATPEGRQQNRRVEIHVE